MKWSKSGRCDVSKARRLHRGFACVAGMGLALFLIAPAPAYPSGQLSPAFRLLPAVKVARRAPLPDALRNSAKEMARLLYLHAVGVTPAGGTPTNSELTGNVNRAAKELAKQLAPGVPTDDALYYDIFGDLGMFTHLVEQTALLTALQHHQLISANNLTTSLKELLGSSAGVANYNKVAILTGRPLLSNNSTPGRTPPRNPQFPHGPLDPNQMGGPIAFSDKVPDMGHPLLVSRTAPAAALYTQPFTYTIRFANLKAASVGNATTITITDTLDPSKLDLNTLRLGLITLENSPTGGMSVLGQLTPPPAAISDGSVKNFAFSGGKVMFTRSGSQITWKLICNPSCYPDFSISKVWRKMPLSERCYLKNGLR